MFVRFFQDLRQAGVPVSLREYLSLMQAIEADLADKRVEDFYYLCPHRPGEGRTQPG